MLVCESIAHVDSRETCPRENGERESRKNMKNYYVYILCNKRNGTLYTGMTSGLIKRVYEHKNKLADSFTKRYNVHNFQNSRVFRHYKSNNLCLLRDM
jgi:hypothetical protein